MYSRITDNGFELVFTNVPVYVKCPLLHSCITYAYILLNTASRKVRLSFAQGHDAIWYSIFYIFSHTKKVCLSWSINSFAIHWKAVILPSDEKKCITFEYFLGIHAIISHKLVFLLTAWSSTHQVSVTPKRESTFPVCMRSAMLVERSHYLFYTDISAKTNQAANRRRETLCNLINIDNGTIL